MAGGKVLVLGATGAAGLCLLRELMHRKRATVAYVRSPSKIPEELSSNPLLEVLEGELDNAESLSNAISKSYIVISLLGPSVFTSTFPYVPFLQSIGFRTSPFAHYYDSLILPLMGRHNVSRILALSTISAPQPEDKFSLSALILVTLIRFFAPGPYKAVRAIAEVFRKRQDENRGPMAAAQSSSMNRNSDEESGSWKPEWTVFRLGALPGGSEDTSWRNDREDPIYAGPVGHAGWSPWTKRGALAKWLVDRIEDGLGGWAGKFPAVTHSSGSASEASSKAKTP